MGVLLANHPFGATVARLVGANARTAAFLMVLTSCHQHAGRRSGSLVVDDQAKAA